MKAKEAAQFLEKYKKEVNIKIKLISR